MAVALETREQVFDAFRRWGYLEADLDPLGVLRPAPHPELDLTGEIAGQARRLPRHTDFLVPLRRGGGPRPRPARPDRSQRHPPCTPAFDHPGADVRAESL